MKRVLSLVLLFSSLASNASMNEWVYPMVVPAVCSLASWWTQPSGPDNRSPRDMDVNRVFEAAAEGSACEAVRRVATAGIVNNVQNCRFDVNNDVKSMVTDSALNAGSLMVSKYIAPDYMPKVVRNVMENPVYRTLMVLAVRNVTSSVSQPVNSVPVSK